MSRSVNETLSREIAQQIGSQAKNPFENAYRATLAIEGACYVQGFLVFAGKPYRPIEYGWIEIDDQVVDPTLTHLGKTAEELSYFPAHRLTVEQLKAAVEEAKEDYPEDEPLPVYGAAPYEYYGDVMLGGQSYQEAFQAALTKCKQLNRQNIQNN